MFTHNLDPRLPLLIWINEDVRENTDRVFEAISYGVTVVQLASIPSAKTWMAANRGAYRGFVHSYDVLNIAPSLSAEFLKQNDEPSSIRFIISQTCIDTYFGSLESLEESNQTNRPDSMLRYIRDQGFAAPVLISSPKKTIHSTRYVEDDGLQMAGSTTLASSVYKEYVAALGARKKDDSGWRKFDATSR